MPGLDGTGPMGMGPITGGGRGWCNPPWAEYRASVGVGYPYYGICPWGRSRGNRFYPWACGVSLPYYSPIYPCGYTPWYPYVSSPWGGPYGFPITPEAYEVGYPSFSPIYPYGYPLEYPQAPSPWGSPYGFEMTPKWEKEWLKRQAESIKQQIDQINSRIVELEME